MLLRKAYPLRLAPQRAKSCELVPRMRFVPPYQWLGRSRRVPESPASRRTCRQAHREANGYAKACAGQADRFRYVARQPTKIPKTHRSADAKSVLPDRSGYERVYEGTPIRLCTPFAKLRRTLCELLRRRGAALVLRALRP